jgi:hypothetical protein
MAWAAASLFLELELWAKDLPTADHRTFGTFDHLAQVVVNAGGAVARWWNPGHDFSAGFSSQAPNSRAIAARGGLRS